MSERRFDFQFAGEPSQRLDHFLVSQIPDQTRSFIQKLIKDGSVEVDGVEVTKAGYKLDRPCVVQVEIPAPQPSGLLPEAIPLDVIYEDEQVILVNKPAGMVVHPSAGHGSGTLVHAVLAHAPDIHGVGGEKRPGLVHRLDKDTSGLIILAKNDQAHNFLQDQFKDRMVEKHYLTLVDGTPPTPSGRVEAAIGRDPSHRQRMAIVPERKGRMALSEYHTVESFAKHTLLDVRIFTGRTHQIRLHMAFLECPVVADRVYGRRNPSVRLKRQFLHAASLTLVLPGQGTPQTFKAPLPPDLDRVLEELRRA